MTEANNFVLFFWCQKSPWGVWGVYPTVQRCRDIWGERALWGDGQKDVGEGQSECLVQNSRTKNTSELVCVCVCVCVCVRACMRVCFIQICGCYHNYHYYCTRTSDCWCCLWPFPEYDTVDDCLCWVSELDTSSSQGFDFLLLVLLLVMLDDIQQFIMTADRDTISDWSILQVFCNILLSIIIIIICLSFPCSVQINYGSGLFLYSAVFFKKATEYCMSLVSARREHFVAEAGRSAEQWHW